MTVLKNTSFKVRASSVDSVAGLNLEAGAIVHDKSDNLIKISDGLAWRVLLAEPYSDTYWVDLLGPAQGSKLDSASTRYRFNFFNGTIVFDANARYPEEPIVFSYQLLHEWKLGTNGKPHLHWKQQSANIPNWLFGYRVFGNGEASSIDTDFFGYTFGVVESHAFTYTSGVLNQISSFPEMDMSNVNLSDIIRVVLFRDTTNVSTLFAGADPSAIGEHISDLDIHIEIDAPGSDNQYIK